MAERILPHAVAELPAIAIAVAAGAVPLVALIRHFAADRDVRAERPRIRNLLADSTGLLGISLVLLIVAATIETWVSTL